MKIDTPKINNLTSNGFVQTTGSDGSLVVTNVAVDGVSITGDGTAGSPLVATPGGGAVTSVSGDSPINSSGGTTPTISIDLADDSTDGYLSSTDWNTFNNKAPTTSPTFATSITGSYLTASEILITDGSKNIVSAAVATYPSLTELTYVKGVTSAIQTQINTKANTAGALTQFIGNGNWKVFYSDGVGDVTELSLGASGTFLQSNGAANAPSFAVPAGSGDVSKVGTPVDNQIGVWTGDGTIEGDAALTFDTSTNTLVIGSGVLTVDTLTLTGTGTLNGVDAIDATTEATIEAAIDTLANLVSVQGLTVTLADAGVDALLGWDDSASAYQNLSAADALAATGGAAAATTITINGTANQITSSAGAQSLAANRTWTLSLPADVLIPTVLTVPNTGLHLLDTNASHDLIVKPGSNITADRTFTITTGDTDMIVDFTAVTDEYVLKYDTGTNTWRGVAESAGSGITVGTTTITSGTDTRVLFNDGGVVGEDAGFTYDKTTDFLTVLGEIRAQTIQIEDSNASHYLTIIEGSNLTANRNLNLVTGDSDRTFTLSGDANISQDYRTSASPQFAGLNIGDASDTTIARVSAGVISVEGSNVIMASNKLSALSATSSAELAGVISDETGSGALMFATSPVITTDITIPNTGLHLLDTNASHDLIIAPGSNITADRTLTVTTGDTDIILNVTAVTDGFVLTYDTGTNSWRGEAASGGGASTALDNLASVAINTSLISDTDSTDSIGSTGVRWLKGWFDDMETTNMPTVGGTAILTSLTAPQFTTIELGHATDTTLSRASAGAISVEGIPVLLAGSTTVGQIPRITGSNTYAWGALNLADTDAVTGALPIANLAAFTKRVNMIQSIMISGTDTNFEPYTILATNDSFPNGIFRMGLNNAAAPTVKSGFGGAFVVPPDFNASGTTKVFIYWTSTLTSGDAVFDVDYRAITGNDSESLDQSGYVESLTVTDTAPGAANRQLITSVTLTSSNLAAGDILEFYFARDGADAADTLAGSALLWKLEFEYTT